jgi:glucose-1-phosphate cytidylyltransferase
LSFPSPKSERIGEAEVTDELSLTSMVEGATNMKVVIFCGGMGMRLRDYSEYIPKPMVPIGYRPILWHVMKYYAHFGHKEFILCLGYRADAIKQYFLNYDECLSNDFTLSEGGKSVDLHHSDIDDWSITFAETGINSNIGMRLKAVEKYLQDDEMFLATYADGLTDLDLHELVSFSASHQKIATFACVKPNLSYHLVDLAEGGRVNQIRSITDSNLRINGGFFVFRREIFDHINDGDELVVQPFERLIKQNQLMGYPYEGFYACMDTFKDKQHLDDLYARGNAPWELWKSAPRAPLHPVSSPRVATSVRTRRVRAKRSHA